MKFLRHQRHRELNLATSRLHLQNSIVVNVYFRIWRRFFKSSPLKTYSFSLLYFQGRKLFLQKMVSVKRLQKLQNKSMVVISPFDHHSSQQLCYFAFLWTPIIDLLSDVHTRFEKLSSMSGHAMMSNTRYSRVKLS